VNILNSFHTHRKTYLISFGLALILITIVASWLKLNGPLRSFDQGPAIYTQYNNYKIFESAFHHLSDNKNLYILYPNEHHDLYKYSPSFALAFGLFAPLPDSLGLILWNLLNVLVFFFAINRKEAPWSSRFPFLFLFIIPELITSTQNIQSNALMTGLLLFAYFDFEKEKTGRAACWIVFASFIKIYAGLAALMFIFYPRKTKFVLGGFIAALVLFSLPLLVITPSQLWTQYQSWGKLISEDHGGSYGISLMQLINLLVPQFHNKSLVQVLGLIGLILVLFPLNKFKLTSQRLNYLSMILLTLIIFNHKTESATFILAVTGIAIWYFSKIKTNSFEQFALILAFLFTVLSATDLFPPVIRRTWIVPYGVKVWPCILIYLIIVYELFTAGRHGSSRRTQTAVN